eukprot:scaffold79412_cov66-Phaeocystis_antarctica.AAC.7
MSSVYAAIMANRALAVAQRATELCAAFLLLASSAAACCGGLERQAPWTLATRGGVHTPIARLTVGRSLFDKASRTMAKERTVYLTGLHVKATRFVCDNTNQLRGTKRTRPRATSSAPRPSWHGDRTEGCRTPREGACPAFLLGARTESGETIRAAAFSP